jgi:tripartite-type tricarboxylate transporter receptor subunit TctC
MLRLLSCLVLSFAMAAAHAQRADRNNPAPDYPNRPVRLIVNAPPGGGTDILGRLIAQHLTAAFGQQFVVDNRGGAGGTLGTRAVKTAAPDGYTLLLGHTGTVSINPTLYPQAGLDAKKDFEAIGMIANLPVALIAHPSFPPKTIGEFIDYAKKNPGKLNVGTSAVGTGGYMTAELFKSLTGTEFQIIPYKGSAPVMNDLLGGHVPVAFGVLPPALGNIKGGNLRAIGVTSLKRWSGLADVPTFDESGLPKFESVLRYGLLAPAGTPKDIVDKLSAELRKLAGSSDVQERVRNEGGDVISSTAEEYKQDIIAEDAKWGGLVKKLNLKVD